MFNRITTLCLLVHDFEASLHFYRDILGLPVNKHEGKYADFDLEGTVLEIWQKDEASMTVPTKYIGNGGGTIISFHVDNVDATCALLQSKGVNIIEDPKVTDWGQTVACFLDPDGNIWEMGNG